MVAFQQINGKRGPQMRLWLDIPKRPSEIAQPRVWNKMVKDSVRTALVYHHDRHIPEHFTRKAREKYGHKPRSDKYKAWKAKKFGAVLDLVMTGSTRKLWTSKHGYQRITMGGAAEGGKKELSGAIVYVWGFNQKLIDFYKAQKANKTRDPNVTRGGGIRARYQNPNRVTLADMRKEMQIVTADEAEHLGQVFRAELIGRIDSYKAGRKRIRA